MKLFATCSSCYKEIPLKQKATIKFEFERKFGEEIEVLCKYCGTSNTKHVNRIFAKTAWYWVILSAAISIFGSIVMFFVFGSYGLFILFAPAAVVFGQHKSINAFNRSMVVRRNRKK
jgi:hypothetical protein